MAALLALLGANASLLDRLGDDALPMIIELLGSPNHQARAGAAKALATFGPKAKDAVPALKLLLTDMKVINHDSRECVCHQAAYALAQIEGDKKYLEGLPKLLPDGK